MSYYPFFWRKCLICQTFLILLLQMIVVSNICAQISVRGFVDSYHAARMKEPHDYLSARNRVRMELFVENDNALSFVSFNGIKNHVLPSQSGIELREAYLDYISANWDMRIGRQIVIWGKADGVQISDVVSPMDYTEFLARDYDDIRIPVDALKFRYLRDKINYELIWVPVFQPGILPTGENPWAIQPEFPAEVEIMYHEPLKPEKNLDNSEFGGKIFCYLPGFDLALSSLYTWDKFPVYRKAKTNDSKINIRPEHHRLTFVGLEFSMPYNALVIRGESAFFKGKYLESEHTDNKLFKKNTFKWLLGLDWYPGSNWTISTQFTGTFIFDYENGIADERHTMFSTLNLSKKFFRETLTLSTFAYAGFNNGDMFDRSSVEYAFTDEFHLSGGIDVFLGDEGMFGQYKDNNEIWLKAKYSF